MKITAAVTTALAVALTASGCAVVPFLGNGGQHNQSSGPTQTQAPLPAPSGQESLSRFYSQRLHWSPCSDFQCAQLTVPIDYSKPDGETIKIAVLKAPARGSASKGALVVNPGGPGGSGVDYAAAADNIVSPAVRKSYDIVGFDPRGVGRSSPIRCLDDRELDSFLGADPTPDTPAEEQGFVTSAKDFAAKCEHRLKPGVANPHGNVAHPEMIDQNPDAAGSQHGSGLRPLPVVGIDLREPSQRLESLQQSRRIGSQQRVGFVTGKVEPQPDHTGVRQVLQRSIGSVRIDNGNRLEPTRIRSHRIQVGRVVGAVSAQLHQHGVAYSMLVENRTERLARSSLVHTWPIAPLAGQWKALRIDDVRMTIDDAFGVSHAIVLCLRDGPGRCRIEQMNGGRIQREG